MAGSSESVGGRARSTPSRGYHYEDQPRIKVRETKRIEEPWYLSIGETLITRLVSLGI